MTGDNALLYIGVACLAIGIVGTTLADERACYTLRDQIRGEVMAEELRRAPHITVCEGGLAREWAKACKKNVCESEVAGRPVCWTDREKELFAVCMGGMKIK